MKLMKSQEERKCEDCGVKIEEREYYYAGPYNCYCKKCGEKRIADKAHKELNPTCKYCKEEANNTIHGKPCCDLHIGKAMEQVAL